jgi:hypothetical protein
MADKSEKDFCQKGFLGNQITEFTERGSAPLLRTP